MALVDKLKSASQSLKSNIEYFRSIRQDPQTPKLAKILLGIAIAYALSPIDLIPDFIPVIGYLDDVIIVGLLVMLAMRMVPKEERF
jgi:uncharacterized membrane protein YkvA (DUF1232 family)